MRNKYKLFNSNILYISILFLFAIAYFIRLFIPTTKIFSTPDVYLSDLIHINYSLKYVLSESLKQGHFPYWTWNVGNGFALIGESQIGAFYLPNIIFFRFLPFNFAFNLGYIFSFFISSLGMFLFLNLLTRNKIISTLCALVFSYSAPMFVQISHYNLLQSYSFIPMIFYIFEIFRRSTEKQRKTIFFLILILLLSQQFFAGYAMTSFITLLFLFIYYVLYLYLFDKSKPKRIIICISFILFVSITFLFFLSSTVQLLPLWEFAKNSTRQLPNGYMSISNSLDPRMLLTYVNFDFFKTFGSYARSAKIISDFSKLRNILWDGNLYIGIIPFIFLIISLFFIRNKKYALFIICYFIALLLALGGSSPLSFLYALFPFNLFRTPSRFTILMSFFSIALIAIFFDKFRKHKTITLIIYLLLIFSTLNLVMTGFSYHPTVEESKFKKNSLSEYILSNYKTDLDDHTIFSFGNELVWYQSLLNKNWHDSRVIQFLELDPMPYVNNIYNIPTSNIFYASYFTPNNQYFSDGYIRLSLFKDLAPDDISVTFEPFADYKVFLKKIYDTKRAFNIDSLKLLQAKGVKILISPLNYQDSDAIKKVYEYKRKIDNETYYQRLYLIEDPLPSFFTTDKYFLVKKSEDINMLIKKNSDKKIILSFSDLPLPIGAPEIMATAANIKKEINKVEFEISATKDSLLVTNISNYPGFKLYVDQIQTKIEEVNYNQIAAILKSGHHKVKLEYEPSWKRLSQIITILSYSIILLIIAINISNIKKH